MPAQLPCVALSGPVLTASGEKLIGGPFGPLENIQQSFHCHCLPSSSPACCASDQQTEAEGANGSLETSLLPAPLPRRPWSQIPSLSQGKHHVTPLSPRLSLAHSLTTYWQKIYIYVFCLDAIKSFFFHQFYWLPSKSKICFHYSIKDINRNSIQNIGAFKWIILCLWSLHSKCLKIIALKTTNNHSLLKIVNLLHISMYIDI